MRSVDKTSGYLLTRRVLWFLVGMIVWMGLPAGLYFLLRGIAGWAAFLIAASLVVLFAALDGRILRMMENRHIDRARAFCVIFMCATSTLIVVMILIISASVFVFRSSLPFLSVSAIGTILLLGLSVYSLLTSRDLV